MKNNQTHLDEKRIGHELICAGKTMPALIRQNPDRHWSMVIDSTVLMHAGKAIPQVIRALPSLRWERLLGECLDRKILRCAGKVFANVIMHCPDVNWRQTLFIADERIGRKRETAYLIAETVMEMCRQGQSGAAVRFIQCVANPPMKAMLVRALHTRRLKADDVWSEVLTGPCSLQAAEQILKESRPRTITNGAGVIGHLKRQEQKLSVLTRARNTRRRIYSRPAHSLKP